MPAAAEFQPPMANGVSHPLKTVDYGNPRSKHEITNGRNGHATHNINGKLGTKYAPDRGQPDIIDIRGVPVESSLKQEIISSFLAKPGQRSLPTILLYDQRGLQIFEEITYLEEYYLTNDEISVLEASASEIARSIPDGSMVVELGSGNLRKVNLLLQAIDDAGKDVDYYALDLSKGELERTLAQVPQYKHVRCHGLLGTYDDGREWLKEPASLGRQKCVMSLGSSIGNFCRHEASGFLQGFSSVLRSGDAMILGVDACSDPGKVYQAYNDPKGITHQFILNGLVHANRILNEEAFKLEDWRVIGEYVYDVEGGRHQAWYTPVRDTWALGQLIPLGERIFVERSVKYNDSETRKLWQAADMVEAGRWSIGNEYGVHLLTKPTTPFPLTPHEYATPSLPTMDDWVALWAKWDAVTRGMLPKRELQEKPIRLRNACIFYLGHIPTFLDIQLTKTTNEPATEPKNYAQIFERGVDPDVDNPELCHSHSEIPDEWPPAHEIAQYQERVRSRLCKIYSRGAQIPRNVARAIWIGFEHEVMHLETLLYMLLQSDQTLAPPGVPIPDFDKMAVQARADRVPNEWFDIPATEIIIGLDDSEDGTDPEQHFGWDNEKPQRRARVGGFQAKARPITNEEYANYMYENEIQKMPTSWSTKAVNCYQNGNGNGHGNGHSNSNGNGNGNGNGNSNGHTNGNGHANGNGNGQAAPKGFLADKAVRTVFGLVPLVKALDWPVFASYDELAGCASWMGGRIPTFEETKSIYTHAARRREALKKLAGTFPAVNGHLSNNGVEETPPDENLFIDLAGANVGFQNWHPVPVTAHGGTLAGQAQAGGVWEWTSSPLRPHQGFEPMSLYPNYTSDFFDGKHNIILGGSWATHPRIAGRKSFVNWYQRNYPYAWAGARLIRDMPN